MKNFRTAICVTASLSLAIFFAVILLAVFWPISIPKIPDRFLDSATFDPVANPLHIRSIDTQDLNPRCRPRILTHGKPTSQVYVLIHGLSNCPAQFLSLGRRIYECGNNVLIPLLPDHGRSAPIFPGYGQVTLQGLADWSSGVIQTAKEMGDEIVIVGLSAGGTLALWMGMTSPMISRAVILAPFLAPKNFSPVLVAPLGKLLARAPNRFIWWNPELRENMPGPQHAYPGFPTKLVGHILVISHEMFRLAGKQAPKCRKWTIITSERDAAVNTTRIREFANMLRGHAGNEVREIWFPAEADVPHDFIDPQQPNHPAGLQPEILRLILEGAFCHLNQ